MRRRNKARNVRIYDQPWVDGGIEGQTTDIQIHAKWLLKTRTRLNVIYSELTGQPLEKIEKDVERDYYMMADEAKEYGLIDSIMAKNKFCA